MPTQIFFAPDGARLVSASTGDLRVWDISPTGPTALGSVKVSGELIDRLRMAADESVAYATAYTNSGDLSSVHRVDMRSGEDVEVISDVRYYNSNRPLVSPDLSVVATFDDDYVSELIQLPGGDSTRLAPCESVRAFDPSGRVAAIDSYLLCEERGEEPTHTSRIVDLETDQILVDVSATVVYAAAFGPPVDDGRPRWAVVVERTAPSPTTLYDLRSGAASAPSSPTPTTSWRAWRCRRMASASPC